MNPLISVIVPVYNQSRELLQKVLSSIEEQTYDNLEVVVVDDGSSENFQFEIFNFQKDLDKVCFRQENRGAPAARNKGFELSRGEYVIFWDADIVGKSDMVEKMYTALREDENASYSYCNFSLGQKKMPAQSFDSEKLKRNNFIHTTSLIRRDDFPGFDESLKRFQDWDLWLTMSEQGKKGAWIGEYLFTIVESGGMSSWLPRFAYKVPFRWLPGIAGKVREYEKGRDVVLKKHNL